MTSIGVGCSGGLGSVIGDYDVWYKPCEKCGYDTARSTKKSEPRCWKCGGRIQRDYSARALKSTPILWEDDGQGAIRGYIAEPRTTLFIIERHPTKPYRGRMTGAVIPDEDEKPDGLLSNALITWLQGCAAPQYLKEFEDRLLAHQHVEYLRPEDHGEIDD